MRRPKDPASFAPSKKPLELIQRGTFGAMNATHVSIPPIASDINPLNLRIAPSRSVRSEMTLRQPIASESAPTRCKIAISRIVTGTSDWVEDFPARDAMLYGTGTVRGRRPARRQVGWEMVLNSEIELTLKYVLSARLLGSLSITRKETADPAFRVPGTLMYDCPEDAVTPVRR